MSGSTRAEATARDWGRRPPRAPFAVKAGAALGVRRCAACRRGDTSLGAQIVAESSGLANMVRGGSGARIAARWLFHHDRGHDHGHNA